MRIYQLVIDTNIMLSGLRSKKGASILTPKEFLQLIGEIKP